MRDEEQLKRDVAAYNRYGYEGVFLTAQWDELVALIGDEAATAWYRGLDGSEEYA